MKKTIVIPKKVFDEIVKNNLFKNNKIDDIKQKFDETINKTNKHKNVEDSTGESENIETTMTDVIFKINYELSVDGYVYERTKEKEGSLSKCIESIHREYEEALKKVVKSYERYGDLRQFTPEFGNGYSMEDPENGETFKILIQNISINFGEKFIEIEEITNKNFNLCAALKTNLEEVIANSRTEDLEKEASRFLSNNRIHNKNKSLIEYFNEFYSKNNEYQNAILRI